MNNQNEQPKAESAAASAKASGKKNIGCLIVGAPLIILFYWFVATIPPDTPEIRAAKNCSKEGESSAYWYSKKFITDALKAPKTAEFPSFGDPGVQSKWIKDCQFEVQAYVDSQNGFGALVRTGYWARITYVADEKVWRLTDRSW